MKPDSKKDETMLITHMDFLTASPTDGARSAAPADMEDILSSGGIIPHFQPIVDLQTGSVFGYEVLSRAPAFPGSISELFASAQTWGMALDLEIACRRAAFGALSRLSEEFSDKHFFLNVSPPHLSLPESRAYLSKAELKDLGVNFKNIVLEITETYAILDYRGFEEQMRRFTEDGFHVALDDFGAGHSGLITLIATAPQFLKIDREIIRDIDTSSYKQNLIRAFSAFASAVEIRLVAEGIEREEELKTVLRLGVQYGQGYFLGMPEPYPEKLADPIRSALAGSLDDYSRRRFSVDLSICSLLVRPVTIPVGTMTCADLDDLFRRNKGMDHVVILREQRPAGLLTRQEFYTTLGGRYGYSIYQKRFVEHVPVPDMLIVDERTDLRVLGKLAMNRNHEELYNPVVIVDAEGRFLGTITIKQLLTKTIDTEIKIASMANPLTGLPGNLVIGMWLDQAVRSKEFSVIYADLNNFKEFNDLYGFSKGDDMIRLTAKVLERGVRERRPECRIGHIGGDDFIVVAEKSVEEDMLRDICEDFDRSKRDFFSGEDLTRGFYRGVNRVGLTVDIPIVALSLAVVTGANFNRTPHPGELSRIAALLKHHIKTLNRLKPKSGYLLERRVYDDVECCG